MDYEVVYTEHLVCSRCSEEEEADLDSSAQPQSWSPAHSFSPSLWQKEERIPDFSHPSFPLCSFLTVLPPFTCILSWLQGIQLVIRLLPIYRMLPTLIKSCSGTNLPAPASSLQLVPTCSQPPRQKGVEIMSASPLDITTKRRSLFSSGARQRLVTRCKATGGGRLVAMGVL